MLYHNTPAVGDDKLFTLKSAVASTETASDSVKLNISNDSGRRVSVDGVGVPTGDAPIEIVSKAEVTANKDIWGPDDAISKIALEINGQPYKNGMALQTGDNTITIYNANNTKATRSRTLQLRLPDQSSGESAYVDIPLLTEAAPTKTLTLNHDVAPIENNPITGAVQTMANPVLTGADGTPQPSVTQYSLSSSEPGAGYHFAGWYDQGSKLSDKRDYLYSIPSDRGDVTLIAKYVPMYELRPNSIKGDYLVSESNDFFSHTYQVDRIGGAGNVTGDHSGSGSDLGFVRKAGAIEQPVDRSSHTLMSWNGPDINVRFRGLPSGIYYPSMKGLTQGQPHPAGVDKQWLTLSKINFGTPAGGSVAKGRFTMKASSVLNRVAEDSVTVKLETPYDDVASLKLISVSAGTTAAPLDIVGHDEINNNKLTWGWK